MACPSFHGPSVSPWRVFLAPLRLVVPFYAVPFLQAFPYLCLVVLLRLSVVSRWASCCTSTSLRHALRCEALPPPFLQVSRPAFSWQVAVAASEALDGVGVHFCVHERACPAVPQSLKGHALNVFCDCLDQRTAATGWSTLMTGATRRSRQLIGVPSCSLPVTSGSDMSFGVLWAKSCKFSEQVLLAVTQPANLAQLQRLYWLLEGPPATSPMKAHKCLSLLKSTLSLSLLCPLASPSPPTM